MTSTVVFLRGMNVGGHRITNDALRAAFQDMGFAGVTTYRASGNVILEGPPGDGWVTRIEDGLQQRLGYAVPTVVRTGAQVIEIAGFDGLERRTAAGGKLQVTLLRTPPSAEVRQAVLALATADDPVVFGDAELFWLPRAGVLDTGLDLKAVDRLLGLGTMRTMGTIEAIAERCARAPRSGGLASWPGTTWGAPAPESGRSPATWWPCTRATH